MSVIVRAFEGTLWTAASSWLRIVLSLASLAVVAREVGPQAYGLFAAVMLVIMVADIFVGGSLAESITQRKDLSDGHADATFWMTTGLGLLIGAVLVVLADPIAATSGAPEAGPILQVLAALLPLMAASSVPRAMLQRDLRFRVVSGIDAVATILSCAAGIALAVSGAGIWTMVAMETIRVLVRLVGGYLAVEWRPGLRGRWRHLTELARFNANTLATYGLGYADILLPRMLVATLLGSQALGYFMLARRVLDELTNIVSGPLWDVSMAACARLQDSREELQRLIVGLYRTASLVAYPAFVGTAVIAPVAIPWMFGPQWNPAVPAIQILMFAGLRMATGTFNVAILRGVGRTGLPLMLLAAGCALQILLIPAFAGWGVAGVALAVLMRSLATWPMGCWFVKSATGLTITRQLSGSLPLLGAAGIMAAVVWGVLRIWTDSLDTPALLAVCVAAGAVTYSASVVLLSPATARMAIALARALRSRDRAQLGALLAQSR